jgi:hypothetical protein
MLHIIRNTVGDGAFGPEEIRILTVAFDDAWERLQKSGIRLDRSGETETAKEKLATFLIEFAQLGERDPRQLADQALFSFAQSNLRNAPRR